MATEAKPPVGPAKVKTAANAMVFAASLCAVIVGVNIIGSRLYARTDLTQDKIYKLSAVSKETVKALPDRLTVKAFISAGLQPPLNKYGQYVRDILDEYASASGGKLAWEAIDPTAPGKDADDTRQRREEVRSKYKIQPITLERLSDTKLEIGSDNFLGIAFVYGEQIESIPQIAATEGLEYQITSMVKKLTATKHKKVGFVSSEGELGPGQGLQLLSRVLRDYDTTTVQLDKAVPDDIDALFIVGPKQPFTDKAKYAIDQHLMKGKPVGLFIDGMVIEAPRGMQMPGMDMPKLGRSNDVGLGDLLSKYGLKVHDDLVLDDQNVMGPVPVEGQLFLANYPTFIGVDDKGFTPHFDLTSHLNAMILPFASSIELVGDLKDGKATGIKATPIARTTKDHSWRQNGFFMFNPQVRLQRAEKAEDKGPFVLGYAVEGKLKSAYPNGLSGQEGAVSSPDASLKEAQKDTRLIVMGTSSMLSDQNMPIQQVPIYRANLLFFLNAIDWLTRDDSLIGLRVKGMGARPLTIPPDSRAALWRYLCEVGIPVAVIFLGLFLWSARTARRRALHL